MDMATQSDLLDALQATQGVISQSFVSQSATELRLNVQYSGAMPLQNAVYRALRGHPGFADMQASAEGRSILLCIGVCGAGK